MSLINNNRAITLLERSLDAASLRQKVISNNLANIDTPNYKRSDVSFEQTLQQVLQGNALSGRRTDARHIQIGTSSVAEVEPEIVTDRTTSMRQDGNNVDIDVEMTNLAENQILYNALSQRINGKFATLKYAISEGKR
ncbi:flagellar basal-body rod protein FlgB [Tumebacillus sp. BK434]|uniref:flagellar basal body rod protein FlgB n=1 Tax=Tumebacillus sp. BK434 TaxID=2512169 RepID=UPI001044BE63|nr:flagellar basal body rod protein FlgB [Tumebacillus sp. BK434]TCP58814.1 flagellar basal-body rod protein FlgB [Tumebacillus sp. BK434]